MQPINALSNHLTTPVGQARLTELYGKEGINDAVKRINGMLKNYQTAFDKTGDHTVALLSAPGRTELGGNHTDHQHGSVLAASVNMDMLAVAAPTGDSTVSVLSEGYPPFTLDLSDLTPQAGEKESPGSIIRGMAAGFAAKGFAVGGFTAYITSDVPPGSGVSSSAAFEVLIGNVLNTLFCESQVDAVKIAKIGQYAENNFFGKPSGLMDQMASSVGGVIAIDFQDNANPIIEPVAFDFDAACHTFFIIDSGADHADLTDAYGDITTELAQVSGYFGKKVLREVDPAEFYQAMPILREKFGDRAVLRGIHFFDETVRAKDKANALRNGDFDTYLRLVNASAKSSGLYLQNLAVEGAVRHQDVTVAIGYAEHLLGGRGAVRVHGGGFAGTIQAFVPNDLADGFMGDMEALLGTGKCHKTKIRPIGGCEVC